MTDPIRNPVPTEDQVYVDSAPVLKPKSRKSKNAELAAAKRDRERNELATMLASEEGQAFIMWLLGECHVYSNPFNPIDIAPHAAAFADGQRSIGLKVLNRIQNMDPEFYPKMLLHHLKRQKAVQAAESAVLDRV